MLVISESFINETKGYRFGDSGWFEPYTDDIGALFRDLRSEYGTCVGHVYVDTDKGETVPVGWVFRKRMEYEDWRPGSRGDRTYLREVWVSVGERSEEDGGVYRYDVKRRKGTLPWAPDAQDTTGPQGRGLPCDLSR